MLCLTDLETDEVLPGRCIPIFDLCTTVFALSREVSSEFSNITEVFDLDARQNKISFLLRIMIPIKSLVRSFPAFLMKKPVEDPFHIHLGQSNIPHCSQYSFHRTIFLSRSVPASPCDQLIDPVENSEDLFSRFSSASPHVGNTRRNIQETSISTMV